jgi:hypothetical protein
MSARRVAACALLLATSCKTRLLDEELPPPDLALCFTHHHVDTAPLALLEALDPVTDLALGRAVRLRLGIALRGGCDLPGSIAATPMIGDATDAVELRWSVWRSNFDDGACGPAAIFERVYVVSDVPTLSSPRLIVRDGAGGKSLVLDLPFAKLDCSARALDAACTADCQCSATDPSARCVWGSGGPTCARPCAEPADCGVDAPACDGARHVCIGGAGCATDGDCPFGQRCEPVGAARSCRPAQDGRPDMPCSCDAQCGFGGVCKLGVDLGYCAIPCITSRDCPSGDTCYGTICAPGA